MLGLERELCSYCGRAAVFDIFPHEDRGICNTLQRRDHCHHDEGGDQSVFNGSGTRRVVDQFFDDSRQHGRVPCFLRLVHP